MMQSAENRALGQTPQGGAASVMESAAMWNEQCGLVGHEQFSDTPGRQGVSVTQTDIPGCPGQRLVTEFVAGQVCTQPYVTAFDRSLQKIMPFLLILAASGGGPVLFQHGGGRWC